MNLPDLCTTAEDFKKKRIWFSEGSQAIPWVLIILRVLSSPMNASWRLTFTCKIKSAIPLGTMSTHPKNNTLCSSKKNFFNLKSI